MSCYSRLKPVEDERERMVSSEGEKTREAAPPRKRVVHTGAVPGAVGSAFRQCVENICAVWDDRESLFGPVHGSFQREPNRQKEATTSGCPRSWRWKRGRAERVTHHLRVKFNISLPGPTLVPPRAHRPHRRVFHGACLTSGRRCARASLAHFLGRLRPFFLASLAGVSLF